MGMVRFFLLLLAVYLLYRAVINMFRKSRHDHNSVKGRNHSNDGNRLIEDPQCGVYISRETAVSKTIAGRKTFFCSSDCADRYVESK